jgi:hypothetical protein
MWPMSQEAVGCGANWSVLAALEVEIEALARAAAES